MADKPRKVRIGLRHIRGLKPKEIIWDIPVPGFGARRQLGDTVSYFVLYRTLEGRQRWYTIGHHGAPWTPDSARGEARRLLGEVAKGVDPAADKQAARKAQTISELCDMYLEDAKAGRLITRRVQKKASTLAVDHGRIERHIKPLLGRRAVTAVTRQDVEAFMQDVASGKTAAKTKTAKKRGLARVRGGKGAANRAVGLLGAIFAYAERSGMRSGNPARGIMRPADGKRDRRLTDDEYKAFGKALQEATKTNIWPPAVAAAHFLVVTGWRSGEALACRWDEIDLARRTATLGDTKTGRSIRPLSHAACDVVRNLTRSGTLVFPASRGSHEVIMSGFKKLFKKITKLGELPPDVTPHTLRHSFTSLAADIGYSEPTIAALVGHKGRTVTSRYIHSADAVLLQAADAVSNRTAELMGEARSSNVVELRKASA